MIATTGSLSFATLKRPTDFLNQYHRIIILFIQVLKLGLDSNLSSNDEKQLSLQRQTESKGAKCGRTSFKRVLVLSVLLALFATSAAMTNFQTSRQMGPLQDTSSNSNSASTANQTTTGSRTGTESPDFGALPSNFKIAFVKPVFTATAYSSFYTFYLLNIKVQPGTIVTTHLSLLNASLVDTWGWSSGLASFINSPQARNDSIVIGKNSYVISDIDVDQGALFYSNGTRKYNAVVLGFTEYVTQREYESYKLFAQAGGKLILLDACNFLAQVAYYPASHRVSLVLGHGWAFNGTAAWRSVYNRWLNESNAWVGSRYALYEAAGYRIAGAEPNQQNTIGKVLFDKFGGTFFKDYRPHEENILTNANDSIIARWNVTNLPSGDSSYVVAAYELNEGNGGVIIHSGVFGSDIIEYDPQFQFFIREAIFPNALV